MTAHHITANHFRQFKPFVEERVLKLALCEYAYISMKDILIQGARPRDDNLLLKDTFQFGYRCTLHILAQPAFGTVAVSADTLGFDYVPKWPNWSGHDSFSFYLKNVLGQDSDAVCLHLLIGI